MEESSRLDFLLPDHSPVFFSPEQHQFDSARGGRIRIVATVPRACARSEHQVLRRQVIESGGDLPPGGSYAELHGRLPQCVEPREGGVWHLQKDVGLQPREDAGLAGVPATFDAASGGVAEEDERGVFEWQAGGQPTPDSHPAAFHGLGSRDVECNQRDPLCTAQVSAGLDYLSFRLVTNFLVQS